MTLNIDLEDVPDAILEAVKARIMANRRRLLDREELLRQPPLQPKPQFRKFGADSRTWKRPQPAAVASAARQATIGNLVFEEVRMSQSAGNTFPERDEFGFLPEVPGFSTSINWNINYGTQFFSTSFRYRLYTASGVAVNIGPPLTISTDITIGEFTPGPLDGDTGPGNLPENTHTVLDISIDTLDFSLPVGGDKYVYVLRVKRYVRSAASRNRITRFTELGNAGFIEEISSSFSDAEEIAGTYCFICDNRTIRPITPKGALGQMLSDPAFYFYPDSPPELEVGDFPLLSYTPNVFQLLNEERSFVPPSQIKTFPANAQPVLGDARSGFFSDEPWDTWQQRLGRPANFAKWRGTVSDVPDIDHGNNANYQRYIPIRNAVPPFTGTLSPDPDQVNSIRRFFVWDWDDPAYCRRMCLALGFTPADLTP